MCHPQPLYDRVCEQSNMCCLSDPPLFCIRTSLFTPLPFKNSLPGLDTYGYTTELSLFILPKAYQGCKSSVRRETRCTDIKGKSCTCSLQQLDSNLPEVEIVHNRDEGSPLSVLLQKERMHWISSSSFITQIRRLSKPSPLQTPSLFLKSIWPTDSHYTFLDASEHNARNYCVWKCVKQGFVNGHLSLSERMVSLISRLIMSEKELTHRWR